MLCEKWHESLFAFICQDRLSLFMHCHLRVMIWTGDTYQKLSFRFVLTNDSIDYYKILVEERELTYYYSLEANKYVYQCQIIKKKEEETDAWDIDLLLRKWL